MIATFCKLWGWLKNKLFFCSPPVAPCLPVMFCCLWSTHDVTLSQILVFFTGIHGIWWTGLFSAVALHSPESYRTDGSTTCSRSTAENAEERLQKRVASYWFPILTMASLTQTSRSFFKPFILFTSMTLFECVIKISNFLSRSCLKNSDRWTKCLCTTICPVGVKEVPMFTLKIRLTRWRPWSTITVSHLMVRFWFYDTGFVLLVFLQIHPV